MKKKCELILGVQSPHITDIQQMNCVFQWSGEMRLETFNTWDFDIETITLSKLLNSIANPRQKISKARFNLNQVQKGNSIIEEYTTRVLAATKLCDFHSWCIQKLTRNAFLFGLVSTKLMKKCTKGRAKPHF